MGARFARALVTSFPFHYITRVKGPLRSSSEALDKLHNITMKGGDKMEDFAQELLETLRLILEALQEIADTFSMLEETIYKK